MLQPVNFNSEEKEVVAETDTHSADLGPKSPTSQKQPQEEDDSGCSLSLVSQTQDQEPSAEKVDEDLAVSTMTLEELNRKKKNVKEKKELLRQLELVKSYQNKWSEQELQDLTATWKDVAVAALEDLHQICSANETLTKKALINHLGIDKALFDLDSDSDTD